MQKGVIEFERKATRHRDNASDDGSMEGVTVSSEHTSRQQLLATVMMVRKLEADANDSYGRQVIAMANTGTDSDCT